MSQSVELTCIARWTGQRLIVGNKFFSRTWVLRNGELNPVSFEAAGAEWFDTPNSGEQSAAPTAASIGAEYGASPAFHTVILTGGVGEPSLLATLRVGGNQYEFRIWEAVAGCAMRLTRLEADVQPAVRLATGIAETVGPTGIETDEPAPLAASDDRDVLESFTLPPGHFRLVQPVLFDQTDFHAELVQELSWLLHPCAGRLQLCGNLFNLESTVTGHGLLLWKHAPLPTSRTVKTAVDLDVQGGLRVAFLGQGAAEGAGDWWMLQAYAGGTPGRLAASRTYQRQWRCYNPARDGLLLSNTWGDRGRDAHLNPEFMTREVEAAARLGVDVVQIDDGWQRGTTSNSAQAQAKGGVWNGFWAADGNFWDVNRERFPAGLEGLFSQARAHDMNVGLWFAPDSSGEGANWERDAEAILRLHRELGVGFIKIDGLKLEAKLGERNAHKFFEKVLRESESAVTFDLDITAEHRFGYLGEMEAGPLFVENRYTDWHRYWPHHTLRVGWQLAHWIDPVRLRLEWLNVARNTEKYEGDLLAPSRWRPDALFATVMFFAPLGWFEVQNLPASYFERAAPLIALWKQHREQLQRGVILPIGGVPDGVAWTGFLSVQERGGYALFFRELNASAKFELPLPREFLGRDCEVLAGSGSATVLGERLEVVVNDVLGFVWVKF